MTKRARFRPKPVAVLIGAGVLTLALAQAYTTHQVSENSKTLRHVIHSTHRIETVIKPICVTVGLRQECRNLLISADEGRVESLCRLTAAVLRGSHIDAQCTVIDPSRNRPRIAPTTPQPSTQPSGGGTSSTTGSPPSSQPSPPQGGGNGDNGGPPPSQGPPGPPGPSGPPGQPAPQPTILDPVCNLTDDLGLPLC